jgi:hypothetical protein
MVCFRPVPGCLVLHPELHSIFAINVLARDRPSSVEQIWQAETGGFGLSDGWFGASG